MTREDHLKFCGVCTKRNFNPKVGIVCSLTGEVANFQGTCADYDEDPHEVRMGEMKVASLKADTKKMIGRGRNVLFLIGGLYLLIGFYESFMMPFGHIIYGAIDWFIAAVFIGMGFLTYKKGSLGLIIGLSFYILLTIAFALIDASTLISGIIWKIIILTTLINSIITARDEEAKEKQNRVPEDLLDQI